jgi:acetoin utilization deacetylase AcuC-like enzyme
MTIPVFYSSAYAVDGGFDTVGKSAAVARSLVDDPVEGVELREPRPVDASVVAEVHDPQYVHQVIHGERGQFSEHGEDFVVSVLASTGGVLEAVKTVLHRGGFAGSLSSGLHHARFDHGAGYCTFNGLVIGAKWALDHGARRVVIIDFDAHCGGGTASLIELLGTHGIVGIEQVDVSVSSFDNYPSRPGVSCRVVGGDDYLVAIGEALESIHDPRGIDLVLYNAGMDVHERAGGVRGIDTEVVRERDARVFEWAMRHDLAVAWVLAGGYSSLDFPVESVARLHRITVEEAARVARDQSKSMMTPASATD